MKTNSLLLICWICFFIFLIFDFKIENHPDLIFLVIIAMVYPLIQLIKNYFFFLRYLRNVKIKNKLMNFLGNILILLKIVTSIVFFIFIINEKYLIIYLLFFWLITISSKKTRGGIISLILKIFNSILKKENIYNLNKKIIKKIRIKKELILLTQVLNPFKRELN
jgi:FlaA1/EpsC-like NDP-sugar epimerase